MITSFSKYHSALFFTQLLCIRIKVVTGIRYLEGFIGDRADKDIWLADKVQGWTESVKNLSGVAHKYPQSAYAGLQKSLKQEWAFVKRVTYNIRN